LNRSETGRVVEADHQLKRAPGQSFDLRSGQLEVCSDGAVNWPPLSPQLTIPKTKNTSPHTQSKGTRLLVSIASPLSGPSSRA
jgi:hypothetical protein